MARPALDAVERPDGGEGEEVGGRAGAAGGGGVVDAEEGGEEGGVVVERDVAVPEVGDGDAIDDDVAEAEEEVLDSVWSPTMPAKSTAMIWNLGSVSSLQQSCVSPQHHLVEEFPAARSQGVRKGYLSF